MTNGPTIKFTGAGSRQQAAALGKAVADGVAAGVAGRTQPLHIDSLAVRLPAHAGEEALQKAIRDAIRRKGGGR